MEPNNIEKQIKEKLNLREIQPSAQAWDKLDAMLSKAENKKQKSKYTWYYIAASIAGFMFIGLVLYYNQETTNPILNQHQNSVVEINTNKEKSSIKKQSVEKEASVKVEESLIKESTIESKNLKEAVAISKNRTLKSDKYLENKQKVIEQSDNLVLEENKIQKEQISNNETINQTENIATIEADISQKVVKRKSRLKIDPQALLSQVDGELELTFREKAIKSITKNFNQAKEALAVRNQE
jgi:lipopolysaccharide export LptBFGC system permease protein LptF